MPVNNACNIGREAPVLSPSLSPLLYFQYVRCSYRVCYFCIQRVSPTTGARSHETSGRDPMVDDDTRKRIRFSVSSSGLLFLGGRRVLIAICDSLIVLKATRSLWVRDVVFAIDLVVDLPRDFRSSWSVVLSRQGEDSSLLRRNSVSVSFSLFLLTRPDAWRASAFCVTLTTGPDLRLIDQQEREILPERLAERSVLSLYLSLFLSLSSDLFSIVESPICCANRVAVTR